MKTCLHGMAAFALATLSACSDQGSAGQKAPAAAPAARPPLISSRAASAPSAPAAMIPPVDANAGTGEAGLAWTTPPNWIEEKPSSPMRRAQYRVPGPGGDGECAVFYFGPGQGGDPMSNADRWADQFTLADGTSARSAMKTSKVPVNGREVVIVDVSGTYKGGMTMTAEPAPAKPGYRLVGAVAPGPDANWFFKFTGPDRTVGAQREAFLAMVRSLKTGGS